jgi:hypothetical protein
VSKGEVVERKLRPDSVRAVRLGHGANCSSIGSVVDILFVSTVIGGAVLTAVLAAMKKERIKIVGGPESDPPAPRTEQDADIPESSPR